MKVEEYFPLGEERRRESPLHIDVSGLNLPGITIKSRSFREKGSEVYVYYNDRKINRYIYTRQRYPAYHVEMACDIYATIVSLFEHEENLKNKEFKLDVKDLIKITPLVIAKCEFHKGVNLSSCNYEVLVTFD